MNKMDSVSKNLETTCLKERLELPRAILSQLRETSLFNQFIDQAIADIDYLLKNETEE